MPIALNHVCLTYEQGTPFETPALCDISLKIEDGQFVGILGHTGCGKSTLVQLIAGLVKPTSGEVLLDGKNINQKAYDRNELRKKVGVLFQYPEYQLFETTVGKDVAFGLKRSGLSRAEVDVRVRRALEMVGFDYEKVHSLSPLGLSGGEKRKVAIAGVLATEPQILILDEPIAGLDPLGRESLLKLLDTLNSSGTTILMISHNTDALVEHAKRMLVLENGKLIIDGTTKEVFGNVDFLLKNRLGTSQPGEIACMLRKQGIEVPQNIIRYDELLAYLTSIGKRGLQK